MSHLLNVISSQIREAAKRGHPIAKLIHPSEVHSPKWRAVEKDMLRKHSSCAACGGNLHLQVHHIQPFHSHPELELDETNLIVLCMGPFECHLKLGHAGNFKLANPNIVRDAGFVLLNPQVRMTVENSARANAIPNEP